MRFWDKLFAPVDPPGLGAETELPHDDYWPHKSHENWLAWGGPASYRNQLLDQTVLTNEYCQPILFVYERHQPVDPPVSLTKHRHTISYPDPPLAELIEQQAPKPKPKKKRHVWRKTKRAYQVTRDLIDHPEDAMLDLADELHLAVNKVHNRFVEKQRLRDSLLFM